MTPQPHAVNKNYLTKETGMLEIRFEEKKRYRVNIVVKLFYPDQEHMVSGVFSYVTRGLE